MTAPSSCKGGYFGKYLLMRIGAQRNVLLVCCVFDLLTLPYFALGHLVRADTLLSGGVISDIFFGYAFFFPLFFSIALLIMAAAGSALSFVYCNRRSHTDMLGCLPLTHRERFWGDFLGGYIAYVAPVIPAGVIAVILSAAAQPKYVEFASRTADGVTVECVKYTAGLALSLFVVYTFAYLISTVVTVSCGRIVHSEILSMIAVILPPLLVMGGVSCFVNAVTGLVGADEVIGKAMSFAPPLGLFFGEIKDNWVYTSQGFFAGGPSVEKMFSREFSVLEPLNIVFYVVTGAILITAAYYLSKSRRQERVGSVMVHKRFMRVMSVLAAAAVIMVVLSACSELHFAYAVAIAAAAGAAAVLVTEVIRKPKKQEIVGALAGWALTLGCCVGAYVLIDKTGAFGLRYFSPDAGKVEYIDVSVKDQYSGVGSTGDYRITEKADIEALVKAHNDTLKGSYKALRTKEDGYRDYFTLNYKLTDGRTVERAYIEKNYRSNDNVNRLIRNLYELEGFPEIQSAFISDSGRFSGGTALLSGMYGTIYIDTEKIGGFAEIFAEDIREKYTLDGAESGKVTLTIANDGRSDTVSIPVRESYSRTIEYLKALYDSSEEIDENTLALRISCSRTEYLESGYVIITEYGFGLAVSIFRGDLESELVKELISLLKTYGDYEPYDKSDLFVITATDAANYYVPESAEERVIEIILELAMKSVE